MHTAQGFVPPRKKSPDVEILPHAQRLDPKKVQKRKKNKILFNFLRLSRFSSKRILLPRTLYPGGKPKNQKDSHLISVLRAITGPNPPRPKHNMISNSSSGDFFSPLLDCCYRRSGPQSHNFVWGRREEKAISPSLLIWERREPFICFSIFPFSAPREILCCDAPSTTARGLELWGWGEGEDRSR